MNILTSIIKQEREYRELSKNINEQHTSNVKHPSRMTGLCDGARVSVISGLLEDSGCKPALIIVPDEKEMMKMSSILSEAGYNTVSYCYRDFVFYNITASHEYEHQRISALTSILEKSCDAVITTPDAAVQYTIPRKKLSDSIMTVNSDQTVDLETLRAFLVSAGYVSTDMVDGFGQFSVRGGIIDIFPAGYENPVRIELFGDEIDSMGFFDILSQRRIDSVDEIRLTPAKEILLDNDSVSRLKDAINAQIKKVKDEHSKEQLYSELEMLGQNDDLRFADKYISVIYPEKECLFDYFSCDDVVITNEYLSCVERVKSYEWHQKQDITSLLEEKLINPTLADYGKWQDDFAYYVSSHAGVILDGFASNINGIRFSALFGISSKYTVSYAEHYDLLLEDMMNYRRAGYKILLLAENDVMAKNLHSLLEEKAMISSVVPLFSSGNELGDITVTTGIGISGFELPDMRVAVLSTYPASSGYAKASGSAKKRKRKKLSSQEKIMSYNDLQPGDYVVHVNHGIGRYLGMESVTVEGVTRDYIKLQYAGTDRLFLPCDQLENISKYIGAKGEDGTLKLSKMGGAEWTKSKNQVKTAAKEMAKELIKLYAERQRLPGFAFDKDDEMQHDFESSFPFEETDGQIAAINDIKKDMQMPRPMDRLLCGDVGFGKTEVALRAAFKAVESGKQVAFLVPTTILALQHYQTLLSRLRGFPVRVDMMSRFKTAKQQQETLRKLRRGEVDIIVGTHRIVSKDVCFKDLGLVIIDEEQRFGVAAKEKLKQLSSGVDTLTLTATPIPRTLNMAMSGIRDMSVLEEAPFNRVPVQTYVLEYDDVIISEAIRKELRRGGQVFYLYNRVETISDVVSKVSAMAPDARITSAHGKMEKEELSDIWRSMLAGEIDILISTTIIESGVDVPNANTLIIENADKLGLAQLHQIRGRVGRSSRRAYAYFTYPKGIILSDIASKRLAAIRDFTEFGSGFKVALRDLEIRGAGDLLGAQQHGHMDTVGYDMYMRLLNEAILEEKGETKVQKTECTVDMNISAYIPESYVKSSAQRIDVYKKISFIENRDDMMDITDELLDRYGNMPRAVSSLLYVSLLRSYGSKCDITKIQKKGNSVIFYPEQIDIRTWTLLATERKGMILMTLETRPYVTFRLKSGSDSLEDSLKLLDDYIRIKNSDTNKAEDK